MKLVRAVKAPPDPDTPIIPEGDPPHLYPFQEDGSKFLSTPVNNPRFLRAAEENKTAVPVRKYLGDDPGMGKTAQAIDAVKSLNPRTVLIIAPKSAHGTWVREFKWWLNANVFRFPRGIHTKARVWLCTPQRLGRLIRDREFFDMIIVDEMHKFRNRKTKQFFYAKQLKSTHLIALSGSPVVNGLMDLWSQFHLLDQQRFPSYWDFENEVLPPVSRWYANNARWAKQALSLPASAAHSSPVAKIIAPYFLRRRKEDYLHELPPKVRKPIYVEMSDAQQELYEQLSDELVALLDGDPDGRLLIANGTLSLLTRLRQTLVTPALYGGPHASNGIDAIAEAAGIDFEAGINVVVVTPFEKAIPYLKEALRRQGAEVYEVSGRVTGDTRDWTIQRFNEDEYDYLGVRKPKALVMSVGVATSFTATGASTAYFLGYAWTPADNLQAEDRIHRIGQTRGVQINYVIHQGTVDEHVMRVLDEKTTWSNIAVNPGALVDPHFLRRFKSA